MPPAPTRALAAKVDFKNCRLLSFIGLFLLICCKVEKNFMPPFLMVLLADLLSFLLLFEFDRISIKSNGWSIAPSKNYAISH